MLQPAVLGGVFIGVLSALPVVNIANCCCAWVIGGGAFAAYLLQQNRPTAISAADGALVGLAAGAIGTVIWGLLSVPINMALGPFQAALLERTLQNAADMPPEVRSWLESMRGQSFAIGFGWFISMIFMLFIGSFFAMLGGLVGALVFRKNPATPPPIPSFQEGPRP